MPKHEKTPVETGKQPVEIIHGSLEDYKLIRYSSVPDETPRWLMYPYIPFGMITVVHGYPGSGKSSMLLDLIARATRGEVLPDGSRLPESIAAVYQCTESGSLSVTKQMLVNAGADIDKVASIGGSFLTINDVRLQRAVRELDASILVIDPLQNFFESGMTNAQSVRRELDTIGRFAVETGCAVILVGHFTKKETSEAQYQGMGSADLAAIARSILHVRRMSERSSLRFIRQVKCNIAPEGEDYGFELVGLGFVNWIGPIESDETEELEIEAKSAHSSKLNAAMDYLSSLLENDDLKSLEAMEQMKAQGFSTATIRRTKQDLGVRSVRLPSQSWACHLPYEDSIPIATQDK